MPKPFKTIDEQLNILKSRGLNVSDDNAAKEFLKYNNYYRISGYSLTLRVHDRFYPNATMQNIIDIYNFDRDLRICLLDIMLKIEVNIKSVFAYHFVQNHGVYGYLDKDNFNCVSNVNYEDLIDKINKTVKVNTSQEDYLKHFQSIQEPLPFWAYIESFTLSDLSKLYTISKSNVQRAVASEFGLKSNSGYKIMCHYLYCLALLRNICAHGGRLYNRRFNTKPNLNKREKALLKTNDDGIPDNSRLFGYVINIQRLARSLDWNVCKDTILKLCEKYPFVDMSYYGFCEDWHKYM